jgi:UDP-glucose 4-epimerase
MGKRIIVTGGAGFIASHLVDRLILDGFEVLVIDNLSSGNSKNLNKAAKFLQADIRSRQAQNVITDFQPNLIDHHAAQIDVRKSVADPSLDASINIVGLLSILKAAAKVKRLEKIIFSSTGGAIYGDTDKLPTTENHSTNPTSPYGISKLTSEHYLRYFAGHYDLHYVCLRYGNVYGPRQNPHGEAGVVAIFTKILLEGKAPTINGDGKQTRDFIFVKDVVEANLKAISYSGSGIFNIGTEKETNVLQILAALKKAIPCEIDPKYGPAKSGEQQRSCLSCTEAKKKLGWSASTSLDEGIRQTVSFFRKK